MTTKMMKRNAYLDAIKCFVPAAEVLMVALLAVPSGPAQLGEINLSRYDHVLKLYLDDGFLKTFA